jgi:putative restriction endonuclease
LSLSDLDDFRIRKAAFDWLTGQVDLFGDVLPRRSLLEQGFPFENDRIHLLSRQGIFKPRRMDLPLSITTTPDGPYDDTFDPNGLLRYRYRGNDPNHSDNVGLRQLIRLNKPLVYFHGIVRNQYLTIWPVYIVADDPRGLAFTVAVDDASKIRQPADASHVIREEAEGRRIYITAIVRQRLHQRSFREKVLRAYRTTCAFCRLRHRELLDAAHIRPDTDPQGWPTVDNGLSLCKLHHAAFDKFILGVTPDYVIRVRRDVLEEEDGPLLRVGLQELDGSRLFVPSRRNDWPSREALAWRYEQFSEAGN